MHQALKSLCLIHIGSWKNSPFPLLPLWGNKIGLPSMKVRKLENFQNRIGLKACKWFFLNVPGTQCLVSDSGCENSIFSFSWGWGIITHLRIRGSGITVISLRKPGYHFGDLKSYYLLDFFVLIEICTFVWLAWGCGNSLFSLCGNPHPIFLPAIRAAIRRSNKQ